MDNLYDAFTLLNDVLQFNSLSEICSKLSIHKGTIKRWLLRKEVPENYFNDLNKLLNNKYPIKETYRQQDQFYTTKETSKYCYDKTLQILKKLDIDYKQYFFIEPSAGCCNIYNQLPSNKRIGIDINPKGNYSKNLIIKDYLDYEADPTNKYIVIGNPPFGLRGNLALRFINHSYKFADVVAFILPPLFDSTGKGVPMKRVVGYKLAHSEKLPLNSFEYPNGIKINIATIFQVWIKINTNKIKHTVKKTCNTIIRVYSLSDGGTPSSTRNKDMIYKCHVYLPSTCFNNMKAYKSFSELPNRRGYGVVFLQNIKELTNLFFNDIIWSDIAFKSTNSAINLRTDIIENQIIQRGFYD